MTNTVINTSPLLRALSSSECIQLVEKLHAVISTCLEDLDSYFDYIWSEYGNGARWEISNDYHAPNIQILNRQLEILSVTNENNLTNVIGDTFDIMPLLFETDETCRNEIIRLLTNKIDEVINNCENDDNRRDMEYLLQSLQNVTEVITYRNKQMEEEICMAEREMVTSSASMGGLFQQYQ